MTALLVSDATIPRRLHPTSLVAESGEMVAIVGPNGGGKTSLLRAMAGVEHSSGTVTIDGERVVQANEARRRTLIAFLPATRDVPWPIAARDVIAMGANIAAPVEISRVIDEFELGDLSSRPMDRLSTGERTRVMLARCLVGGPRLLLLDEPLSNLDPYWALRVLEILGAEAQRGTIVMASLHDLDRIGAFDRALLVSSGRVQLDENPLSLMKSERFEEIFRVRQSANGWTIKR